MDNPTLADVVAEYRQAAVTAWDEYSRALNAAYAEYEKATDAAYAEYDEVAYAEYDKVAYAEYYKVRDSTYAEYRKVLDAAWFAMADKTSDPLTLWIIKNCSEHQEEASIVLEILPASLEELNEMASNQGWCEVWDGLVAQAREDGVIL